MNENFCQRLARIREATGLNHQELAKKSNLTLKKIKKLETDLRYVPSWEEISKLAKALKADRLYLATGDVYCFPTKRRRPTSLAISA